MQGHKQKNFFTWHRKTHHSVVQVLLWCELAWPLSAARSQLGEEFTGFLWAFSCWKHKDTQVGSLWTSSTLQRLHVSQQPVFFPSLAAVALPISPCSAWSQVLLARGDFALLALACSGGRSHLEIQKPPLQNPPGSLQITKWCPHQEPRSFQYQPSPLISSFTFQNSNWILGPCDPPDIQTIIYIILYHEQNINPQRAT